MTDKIELTPERHEYISDDCAEAEAEITRLREALAWYADEGNYNDDHAPGCKSFLFDWTFDRGERARRALK